MPDWDVLVVMVGMALVALWLFTVVLKMFKTAVIMVLLIGACVYFYPTIRQYVSINDVKTFAVEQYTYIRDGPIKQIQKDFKAP